MERQARRKWSILAGAAMGAILGAGAAYLLATTPAEPEEGQEPQPITATELLTLTGSLATLIRRLDDIRRRI